MAAAPTRLEIDDTVLLQPSVTDERKTYRYGRVERTYHDVDYYDPLEDCLIVEYQTLATGVLQHFTSSGRPPKGYVFVAFAYEIDGHALLLETSLRLLSRAHAIGDVVKQDPNSAIFGTVIDVKSSYLVTPMMPAPVIPAPGDSPETRFTDHVLAPKYGIYPRWSFQTPSCLLERHGLDGDELKRAEDFQVGDQVVSQDWCGIVEETDQDVAILLETDAIVWVEKPWELELVVDITHGQPLMSISELDGIQRPDVLNVYSDGLTSMTPKRLRCGDLVVTNKRNIEKGRWLRGGFNPSALPQGRVLDIRTRRIDINWLVPNPFIDYVREEMPRTSLKPYQNLTSFRHAQDLRSSKDMLRYDHHKKPAVKDKVESGMCATSSGDPFYPGDRVYLRNAIENGYKHKSQSTTTGRSNQRGPGMSTSEWLHGSFVPPSEAYGFDLNEYMVCFGQHETTVMWQDGTTTQHDSIRLIPYSMPESDLSPGDLVMAKEGLKMTTMNTKGENVTSNFNEMAFFEREHILRPAKVGVVQSVESQERLARVRWYADPKVELAAYGQVLAKAQFGRMGDVVEDMSLYEIMTEPALVRKQGDLVVIPPQNPTRPKDLTSVCTTTRRFLKTHPLGPTTLSYLQRVSWNVLPGLWEIARPFAITKHSSLISTPEYDWIGVIVNIGTDGSLTVRLGCTRDCRDVVMSQDEILLTVDENSQIEQEVDESMEPDQHDTEQCIDYEFEERGSDDRSDEVSAIDEIVEYEGGERFDNESRDDDWSTDDGSNVVDVDDARAPADTHMVGADLHHRSASLSRWLADIAEVKRRRQTTERPVHEAGQSLTEEGGVPRSRGTGDTQAAATVGERHTQTQHSSPSHSMETVEVYLLAQHLGQRNPPASFEVLEQLPPPDQYNNTEIPTQNPAFLKRIAKEHRILTSSLPVDKIYVRTYESRLDLLRCLIVGPADTPYEYCPFLIDLYLGPNFPAGPPRAHFHSWTSGLGKINPNLYEEGKICLSLLGTWPAQSKAECWSADATILQLLVSLQGLVFVDQPFYNEAGFEAYGEEKVYSLESQQYSEKAYVMARGFVKYALLKAPGALEDVIAWLYLCNLDGEANDTAPPRLLSKIIERARLLMERSPGLKKQQASIDSSSTTDTQATKTIFLIDGAGDSTDVTKTFLKPLSQGALVMLRKTLVALENIQQQYSDVAVEAT